MHQRETNLYYVHLKPDMGLGPLKNWSWPRMPKPGIGLLKIIGLGLGQLKEQAWPKVSLKNCHAYIVK